MSGNKLNMPQAFTGSSIRLQKVDLSMVCDMYTAIDKNKDHVSKFLPWITLNHSKQGLADFYQKKLQEWEDGKCFYYVIIDQKTDTCVGAIDIMVRKGLLKKGIYNFGYWLVKESCGKGFMVEALTLLKDFLLVQQTTQRLLIKTDASNIASAKTAGKAGFVFEGMNFHDATTVDGQPRNSLELVVIKDSATMKHLVSIEANLKKLFNLPF